MAFFQNDLINVNGSTAKTIFTIEYPKICLSYFPAGAHTGAPLRLY